MEKNIFTISTKIEDLLVNTVVNRIDFVSENQDPLNIHAHVFNEVFVVKKGKLLIEFSEEKIELDSGYFCFIPPGVFHCSFPSKGSEIIGVRFYCLKNLQSENNVFFNEFVSVVSSSNLKYIIKNDLSLCDKIIEVYEELGQSKNYTDIYVKALLTQVYVDLYRQLSIEKTNICKDDFLQNIDEDTDLRLKIDELFNDSMGDRPTAKEFAEKLHFSQRHFNRILNKFYGKSFKEILTDFRLERSAKLLVAYDCSIEEIAYLCGYSSVKNFNVAFRTKFLTSPKNYRKSKK